MARKSRSLDEVKTAPWRFVAFADLHYGAKTMDRALTALECIADIAEMQQARVVFCGDFWDARGVLSVRHLDPLIDEMTRWRARGIEAIFIPGNHDQVSADGMVHGLRVLEPFHNIRIATEPIIWEHERIAFLPWREEGQAEFFEALAERGNDWTIFAHAEITGARTNHGYEAPGRVNVKTIERAARACYLGHYHLRQQHGDRTWYLGNPFELNFGEMGEPKGVAIITPDRVEPEWFPFTGFPRHHRLTWGEPYEEEIRSLDVVELYMPREILGTEEAQRAIHELPAEDVRPLPLDVIEEDEDKAPSFALTLDEALVAYVEEQHREEETHAGGAEWDAGEMISFGKGLLAEIPEAYAVQPMTSRVEIERVSVRDFCAIRDTVDLDLERRGLMLIKGPIGSGKTSLIDAVTWCLYGQTSPRKAGSGNATYRGDEVVHDNADDCEVEVTLYLPELNKRLSVVRRKKRGKGAKAKIEGDFTVPSGIDDTQQIIDHVIGLDYDLWRTCVSLGQGAVGNFTTDADKARKQLLSRAHGLTVCPVAQKLARDRLAPVRVRADKIQMDTTAEERALEVLDDTDYTVQIEQWESQRQADLDTYAREADACRKAIQTCDENLATKGQWIEMKERHEEHVAQLQAQLGALPVNERLFELEREHGGAAHEQSILQQQLAKAKHEHAQLRDSFERTGAKLPCPTCGKPMDNSASEKVVRDKQNEVERLNNSIASFNARLHNLAAKISDLRKGHTSQHEQIQAQIEESRQALQQIGTALNTFVQFESNRQQNERRLQEVNALWQKRHDETNPFESRARAHAEKAEQVRQRIEQLRAEGQELAAHRHRLEFWADAFGPKGLPVLVLRTALYELQHYANHFLAQILHGRIFAELAMTSDSLQIRFFEQCPDGEVRERRYEQLSGGMRRCVELAFSPFALSEMVFNRCGVRVPLLMIDELTTHLGQEEKPLVCEMLRSLDRDTILVVDHDIQVQGEFDEVCELDARADASPALEAVG